MYGRIPILPKDVEFGVMIQDITHAIHQNYGHIKRLGKIVIEKLPGISSIMTKSLNA